MAIWCYCEGFETTTENSIFDGKQSKVTSQESKRTVCLHCHYFSSESGSKEINIVFDPANYSAKMSEICKSFFAELRSSGKASYKDSLSTIINIHIIDVDTERFAVSISNGITRIQFERSGQVISEFFDTLEACIKWAEEIKQ